MNNMSLPVHFISIDWGTSNFRLRVVQTDTLQVLLEYCTDQGVKTLHHQFSIQNRLRQSAFFKTFLQQQIQDIPLAYQDAPVVVSGMASSSLGIKQLPYSSFPFDHSAQQLHAETFSLPNGKYGILTAGVKGESGMMRGEEIQALGLSPLLPHDGMGTLLLPGTHSKHLQFNNGEFLSLQTFMTGERFNLLCTASILQQSVQKGQWQAGTESAFLEGVKLGYQGLCTPNLFGVRARDLLGQVSKTDNYYVLSGLLIGEELSHLPGRTGHICLAASNPLFDLYKIALLFALSDRPLMFFDETQLNTAFLEGQRKMLEIYANRE